MNQVITRFAPSPTGYLHIGSARTALFNYLYAKANNGKFLLRIEDTDQKRSTCEAVDALLNGLKWLGLNWDGQELYQFSRSQRHKEIALELLAKGKAYKCFLTSEELEVMREEAMKTGKVIRSKWRDADPSTHPNIPYVIRIKAPQVGTTIIKDQVQGEVVTENSTLDDMVLLRSDGTPTYMLAVVVDDYDTGITHIIRGDDHLGNAARQMTIYNAMEWKIPIFAHIPLIHGEDGKKLSKRHGALGVEGYRDLGYLPETICNYLLRLGWSHGNDEFISKEQAIEWFNLESIGKSPARLDFKKLNNVNNHYLKLADNQRLLKIIETDLPILSEASKNNILKGLDSLKQRSDTLIQLASMTKIYIVDEPIVIAEDLRKLVMDNLSILEEYKQQIQVITNWEKENLMDFTKKFAAEREMKLGDFAGILRILLTGSTTSPSVFEIMAIIGCETTIKRLNNVYSS